MDVFYAVGSGSTHLDPKPKIKVSKMYGRFYAYLDITRTECPYFYSFLYLDVFELQEPKSYL